MKKLDKSWQYVLRETAAGNPVGAFIAEAQAGLAGMEGLNRGTPALLDGVRALRALAEKQEDQEPVQRFIQSFAECAIGVVGERVRLETLNMGALGEITLARRDSRLWHELVKLTGLLHGELPGENVGVKWLREKHGGLFKDINDLCGEDWALVSDLLPVVYRNKFVVEKAFCRAVHPDDYSQRFEHFQEIAEKLGDAAVADMLISGGLAATENVELLRRQIREHLGPCNPSASFTLNDIKKIPPELLRDPQVERVIFVHLRDHVYGMMSKPADLGIMSLNQLWGIVRSQIKESKYFNPDLDVHMVLQQKLFEYWESVVSLDCGEKMVAKVTDEADKVRDFPSLRQRVSVVDLAGAFSEGRQLNAFSMGKGKSACPFLAWEHLKLTGRIGANQKMLLTCPPTLITQFEDRIAKKYYKEGHVPKIGVIASGRTQTAEDIGTAMECEIIIVADSMLPAVKMGKDGKKLSVLEAIQAQDIGFLCVDEAHRFRNPASGKAGNLEAIALTGDGKRKIPFMQLLSASPMPNRIRDMLTYMDVMYPEDSRRGEHVAEIDPLRLRNVFLRCLLTLDPPENWKKHVEYVDYTLGEKERELYDFFLAMRELTVIQKLLATRQLLLNPELQGGDPLGEHALFEKVCGEIQEDLKTVDCVLVSHGAYTAGFIRPNERCKSTWIDKLKAELPGDVEIEIIDGAVDDKERKRILNLPKTAPGKKRVILAHADTIRLGVSLVHIKRVHMLEHDFNEPDFHQFCARYNRAGNVDSKIKCYYGLGTISEVIKIFAQLKAVLCNIVHYGGALTQKHIKDMEAAGADIADIVNADFEDFSDPVIRGALMIMDELLTAGAYVERVMRNFNSRGEDRLKKVFATGLRAKEFADRYLRDYATSYRGNNARLVAATIRALHAAGHLRTDQKLQALEVYSGPLGLNTLVQDLNMEMHSMDPNSHLLEAGKAMAEAEGISVPENHVKVGGVEDMKAQHESQSLDLIHLNLCANVPKNRGKIQMLVDANSRLALGGHLMISLPHYIGSQAEREKFAASLVAFGFELQSDFTGAATAGEAGDRFEAYMMVAKKTAHVTERPSGFESSDLQLKVMDRAKNPQSLCVDHHQFKLGPNNVSLPRTTSEFMKRHTRIQELLGQLAGILQEKNALTEADIPAEFSDMNPRIIGLDLRHGKQWHLGVRALKGHMSTFPIKAPSPGPVQA